jgi:hypothetical protein
MARYEVGSVIEYETFGGGLRVVRVEVVEANIKNGLPGFDGTVVEGPDRGMSVWGYDDQIVRVRPGIRSAPGRLDSDDNGE